MHSLLVTIMLRDIITLKGSTHTDLKREGRERERVGTLNVAPLPVCTLAVQSSAVQSLAADL